jgi:hypothetical protein
MTVTKLPSLRLRQPADALAAIPYLLGFHPADSVVVLAMQGPRVVFNVRADLPDETTEDAASGVVEYLVEVLGRQHATGAIVAGFGTAARADPTVVALALTLEERGVRVIDVLRAEAGRYWSYRCQDPGCCPAEGRAYDPVASEIAADATLAGLVARPDRRALLALVEPTTGPGREGMSAAGQRADVRLFELIRSASDQYALEVALRRELLDAVESGLDGLARTSRLDDDHVAWLSLLLFATPSKPVWDLVVAAGSAADGHRDLWSAVVRRADDDLVAAPGTLLALAAWRCGDGALAAVALDRVLRLEPDYPLAAVLAEVVSRGTPPSILDVRAGARRFRPVRGRQPHRRSSTYRAGSRSA